MDDLSLKPDITEQESPSTIVRLAKNNDEIVEAQKMRYAVFYDEYGAHPTEEMKAQKRDFDNYDDVADHLIAISIENGQEKIVGTYRLLTQEKIAKIGSFYSSQEYNLEKLLQSNLKLLELGRSCVLQNYRTKPVLNALWQGIAEYINEHDIDVMFGCGSFSGITPEEIAEPLSYLYHFHLCPTPICPTALESRRIEMNILPKDQIDERRAINALPPLIKGYLRTGASVGNGAVIDHQFNTTDVCIVVETKNLSEKYRRHYDRENSKPE